MPSQSLMGRHKLVARLASQVGSEREAISLLKRRGQMSSDGKLTAAGRARDRMTASERAVDRASRASGKPLDAYRYDPTTNSARLK